MTNSSAEFRKIWIEQCAATEDIREHFGLKNALEYLIGEKLFTFVTASDQDPDFAAEFRRLSPQSGGCLPLVRFANISTTWSRRSFWLRRPA